MAGQSVLWSLALLAGSKAGWAAVGKKTCCRQDSDFTALGDDKWCLFQGEMGSGIQRAWLGYRVLVALRA